MLLFGLCFRLNCPILVFVMALKLQLYLFTGFFNLASFRWIMVPIGSFIAFEGCELFLLVYWYYCRSLSRFILVLDCFHSLSKRLTPNFFMLPKNPPSFSISKIFQFIQSISFFANQYNIGKQVPTYWEGR